MFLCKRDWICYMTIDQPLNRCLSCIVIGRIRRTCICPIFNLVVYKREYWPTRWLVLILDIMKLHASDVLCSWNFLLMIQTRGQSDILDFKATYSRQPPLTPITAWSRMRNFGEMSQVACCSDIVICETRQGQFLLFFYK